MAIQVEKTAFPALVVPIEDGQVLNGHMFAGALFNLLRDPLLRADDEDRRLLHEVSARARLSNGGRMARRGPGEVHPCDGFVGYAPVYCALIPHNESPKLDLWLRVALLQWVLQGRTAPAPSDVRVMAWGLTRLLTSQRSRRQDHVSEVIAAVEQLLRGGRQVDGWQLFQVPNFDRLPVRVKEMLQVSLHILLPNRVTGDGQRARHDDALQGVL